MDTVTELHLVLDDNLKMMLIRSQEQFHEAFGEFTNRLCASRSSTYPVCACLVEYATSIHFDTNSHYGSTDPRFTAELYKVVTVCAVNTRHRHISGTLEMVLITWLFL